MNLVLFININDIKKREQNMLESKFKNIFLSSISHNLKTPLNSINITNEILFNHFRRNPNGLAYSLVKNNRDALKIMNMQIQDMLDYSSF